MIYWFFYLVNRGPGYVKEIVGEGRFNFSDERYAFETFASSHGSSSTRMVKSFTWQLIIVGRAKKTPGWLPCLSFHSMKLLLSTVFI